MSAAEYVVGKKEIARRFAEPDQCQHRRNKTDDEHDAAQDVISLRNYGCIRQAVARRRQHNRQSVERDGA